MAFGRKDTDAVYDKAIAPVLRGEDVTPVRVDRREHNRNINDVIIEELLQSDLVLADLTYARPSVYFEAGFGERAGPVIYTVREDHLGAAAKMRVHFDVSMRNILTWKAATDAEFIKRLRRRVRHVLKPMRAQRQDIEERRARELEFTSRPHREQAELLRQAAAKFLKSKGLDEDKGTAPSICAYRVQTGRVRWSTCVLVLDRWVRNRVVADWLASSMMLSSLARSQTGVKAMEHHVIFAITSAVPFSKVRATFPQAHADLASKTVSFSRAATAEEVPTLGRQERRAKPAETTFVHLVDSVRSEESLLKRLAEILPRTTTASRTTRRR